jgi:hypothetical protein
MSYNTHAHKPKISQAEVRWDNGSGEPVDKYTFFYGSWNTNCQLWTGFLLNKGIISAV